MSGLPSRRERAQIKGKISYLHTLVLKRFIWLGYSVPPVLHKICPLFSLKLFQGLIFSKNKNKTKKTKTKKPRFLDSQRKTRNETAMEGIGCYIPATGWQNCKKNEDNDPRKK